MSRVEEKHKVYIIEHISDFLKIPKEKWDLALEEFRAALKLQYYAEILIRETNLEEKMKVSCLKPFLWIDDGRQDIHVNLVTKEKIE